MAKFIKLTGMLLNANDITKIVIKPNKYVIYICGKKFNGFMWSAGSFGLGNVSTDNDEIEVCETKNPIDYKIVSEWINHQN